jgi:hypothetical protein
MYSIVYKIKVISINVAENHHVTSTSILDFVTLTLVFDLLIANFNIDSIFLMVCITSVSSDSTFPIDTKRFDLMTLPFDLKCTF